ncbi:hypothetical protein Lser_V15G19028 [Lactuca serriola]
MPYAFSSCPPFFVVYLPSTTNELLYHQRPKLMLVVCLFELINAFSKILPSISPPPSTELLDHRELIDSLFEICLMLLVYCSMLQAMRFFHRLCIDASRLLFENHLIVFDASTLFTVDFNSNFKSVYLFMGFMYHLQIWLMFVDI